MKIYMDNCSFNRPFDDQSRLRVRLEAEAKLDIQERVQRGEVDIAWSYMLEYENQANPFEERTQAIGKWKTVAVVDVDESPEILERAMAINRMGVRSKDALHIACAIAAQCEYFLTTDDTVLKRMKDYKEIAVMNPTEFIVGAEQ